MRVDFIVVASPVLMGVGVFVLSSSRGPRKKVTRCPQRGSVSARLWLTRRALGYHQRVHKAVQIKVGERARGKRRST